LRPVRAFKQGMAPLVIGLLTSTAWIMGSSAGQGGNWHLWLVAITSGLIIWRTRLHLMWLLAGGGLLRAFGLI
jgi:chromate transporter